MSTHAPARRLSLAFAALGGVALLLAGCGEDTPPTPGDAASTVTAMGAALRANDLAELSRLALPEDLREQARARWDAQRAALPAPSEEESRQFAEALQRLTAPDAEATLMAELEPMLAQFEAEGAQQLPMMAAMGSGFVQAQIASNPDFNDSQKAHASAVVGALAAWLPTAPLTDRAKAREAIGAITGTARAIEITELAQFQQLGYDDALAKGGLVVAGVKQVFAAYGLDANASLDGLQARQVSGEGDAAVVEVSYPLAGQTIRFEMPMVRRDGGWYSAEAIAEAEAIAAGDEAGGEAPAAPAAAEPSP